MAEVLAVCNAGLSWPVALVAVAGLAVVGVFVYMVMR